MNQISLNRIFLLIKRYVMVNLKTYLIGFAAMGATLFALTLLITWSSGGNYNYTLFQNQMQVVTVLGGLIITSTIFKELNSKHSGWLYMMLPANPSEKILSYWLLTSIGYIVTSAIAMVVLSIITSITTYIFFKTTFFVYNPFNKVNAMLMVHYCISQSVFFLGAIYFKKNHFLKTILSIMIVNTAIAVIIGIITYLLFNEMSFEKQTFINNEPMYNFFKYVLITVYYILVLPFFVIVSYFRFKEREV